MKFPLFVLLQLVGASLNVTEYQWATLKQAMRVDPPPSPHRPPPPLSANACDDIEQVIPLHADQRELILYSHTQL
jgi:hypothetical protein